ncbi:hypothetical protein [Leuconostoc citreum]|uniref:hypothetical protein n=1 Tax=Leuconostoc citreum TaxID=33964 RepID=UPI0032DF2BBA
MEKETQTMGEEQLLLVKRTLRIYSHDEVAPLKLRKKFISIKLACKKKEKQRILYFGGLWDFMTDMSISYLTTLLKETKKRVLTDKEAENVRLIGQTLCANRWEYTQRQSSKPLPQIARNKLGPIFVKTSLELILDKEEIFEKYEISNDKMDYFRKLFQDAITNYKDNAYSYIIREFRKKPVF